MNCWNIISFFKWKNEYTYFNQYETGVQSLRSFVRFQLSMLCLMVFKKCQLIRFKVVYSFVKLEFMFTLQFESQIPPYYTAHYIAASLLKLHNTPTVFNFSLRSIFFHAPLPQENFFPGTDFYFNFSFFVQNQNFISLKWYSRELIVFNDKARWNW